MSNDAVIAFFDVIIMILSCVGIAIGIVMITVGKSVGDTDEVRKGEKIIFHILWRVMLYVILVMIGELLTKQ